MIPSYGPKPQSNVRHQRAHPELLKIEADCLPRYVNEPVHPDRRCQQDDPGSRALGDRDSGQLASAFRDP
jgi:hypothetical protein